MIKGGIMDLLESLNENQYQAATTLDCHVRIIAGAGSGKTRVLMARIAYLVKECGIWPNRIMAITFTNKATNEMKERLAQQLDQDARMVRISTIHSLCVRILREDADLIGYPKSFAIFDSDDQKQILRPIYKKMGIELKSLPMNRVLSYISGYKSEGVNPDQAIRLAMNDESDKIANIYLEYEKNRKEMKAMDFDDLLIEAHHLLKTKKSVCEKWQNRLDYIHVDEFQDVDPIQYEIIRFITGKQTYLCVVGDPDQTIYTWRGASVDIILRFDKDFPNCKTIILNENYRSIQPILNASNALIQYNKKRIEKDLYSKIEGNQKLILHACKDDNDEPLYVVKKVHERHKQGIDFKDMAILYRSNFSSRAFENVLRKVGIPYVIYGGIRFYERQEIKDILAYLKLCTYPDEMDPKQLSLDLAVLRVINQPRRGIGQKSIESLQQEAATRQINLYEELKNPEYISSSVISKTKKFVDLIENLRNHREDYSLEDFVDYVLDQTGYKQMLLDNNEEERLENLQELRQDIAQSLQENPQMTLEDYLQEISLFTDKSQEQKNNSISLMTIHAAKGLEFDSVFIVNFNDGIFPSSRAIDEGGKNSLEEERRLCYVAMTRAKNYLSISWNRGYSYMLETVKTRSRFVMEIPKEWVEEDELEKSSHSSQHSLSSASQHSPIFESHPMTSSKKKMGNFRKGDIIQHTVYGQGVILDVQGNIIKVAFNHKIGVKKMNALHPSIKKV